MKYLREQRLIYHVSDGPSESSFEDEEVPVSHLKDKLSESAKDTKRGTGKKPDPIISELKSLEAKSEKKDYPLFREDGSPRSILSLKSIPFIETVSRKFSDYTIKVYREEGIPLPTNPQEISAGRHYYVFADGEGRLLIGDNNCPWGWIPKTAVVEWGKQDVVIEGNEIVGYVEKYNEGTATILDAETGTSSEVPVHKYRENIRSYFSGTEAIDAMNICRKASDLFTIVNSEESDSFDHRRYITQVLDITIERAGKNRLLHSYVHELQKIRSKLNLEMQKKDLQDIALGLKNDLMNHLFDLLAASQETETDKWGIAVKSFVGEEHAVLEVSADLPPTQRIERIEKSPDLDEAVEKLRPQVLIIQKFFDGSLHRERADQKSKVVTISELLSQIDLLNKQINELRQDGKQFRAINVWKAVVGMPIAPDSIDLSFPTPSNYIDYISRVSGLMYSAQSMYLRINESDFTIIDYREEPLKKPTTVSIDSWLFTLQIDKKMSFQADCFLDVVKGDNEKYWKETLIHRMKEYGFDVYLCEFGDTEFSIYIDLHSNDIRLKEGKYLRLFISKPSYQRSRRLFSDSAPTLDDVLQ